MAVPEAKPKSDQVEKPRYPVHPIAVRAVEQINPRRRRIIFQGETLAELQVLHPGQWVKLFFPSPHGEAAAGRAYTILAFDAAKQELTVDFFLHEGGIASAWAKRAQVGDRLTFAGPAGTFRIVEGKDWYLFVADDSSLAALLAIAASLPSSAVAYLFIETVSAEEQIPIPSAADTKTTWIDRSKGTTLLSVLQTADFPAGHPQVWVTGETASIHAVRQVLMNERQIARADIHASGYWKTGRLDHKDPESDY
jgi:NADPH-dependent ferric siderophore reductase